MKKYFIFLTSLLTLMSCSKEEIGDAPVTEWRKNYTEITHEHSESEFLPNYNWDYTSKIEYRYFNGTGTYTKYSGDGYEYRDGTKISHFYDNGCVYLEESFMDYEIDKYVRFEYDNKKRLLKRTTYNQNDEIKEYAVYTYNDSNLTGIVTIYDNERVVHFVNKFTYDKRYKPLTQQIYDSSNNLITTYVHSYDTQGRVISRIDEGSGLRVVHSYEYPEENETVIRLTCYEIASNEVKYTQWSTSTRYYDL